jgi:hypothetical protein
MSAASALASRLPTSAFSCASSLPRDHPETVSRELTRARAATPCCAVAGGECRGKGALPRARVREGFRSALAGLASRQGVALCLPEQRLRTFCRRGLPHRSATVARTCSKRGFPRAREGSGGSTSWAARLGQCLQPRGHVHPIPEDSCSSAITSPGLTPMRNLILRSSGIARQPRTAAGSVAWVTLIGNKHQNLASYRGGRRRPRRQSGIEERVMQRQGFFAARTPSILLRLGGCVARGFRMQGKLHPPLHPNWPPIRFRLASKAKRFVLTSATSVIGECRFNGRKAVDNLHRSFAIAAAMVAWLLAGASAMAQDSSPYVVGLWRLNDGFQDVTPSVARLTENTDFVFLNPTNLTLTLEYAFFAPDGTFCGCDRDTLQPNGRTRYTMLGERQGGSFSTKLCPAQTEGVLKSIVFTNLDSSGSIVVGDALQAGVQIHMFGSAAEQRSESNLQGVTINNTTTREMNKIHRHCVRFLGS